MRATRCQFCLQGPVVGYHQIVSIEDTARKVNIFCCEACFVDLGKREWFGLLERMMAGRTSYYGGRNLGTEPETFQTVMDIVRSVQRRLIDGSGRLLDGAS